MDQKPTIPNRSLPFNPPAPIPSDQKIIDDFLKELTSPKLKIDTRHVVDALYGVYEARGKQSEQFFPYPFDAVEKSGVDAHMIPIILGRLTTAFVDIASSIKATPEELKNFPENERAWRTWKQATVYNPYNLPLGHVSPHIKMYKRFELLHQKMQQQQEVQNDQGTEPTPTQSLTWNSEKGEVTWQGETRDISKKWAVKLFLGVMSKHRGKLLYPSNLMEAYNSFTKIKYEECKTEKQQYCKQYNKTHTKMTASLTAANSLKALLEVFDVLNNPKLFPIQNQGSDKSAKVIWLRNNINKARKGNRAF